MEFPSSCSFAAPGVRKRRDETACGCSEAGSIALTSCLWWPQKREPFLSVLVRHCQAQHHDKFVISLPSVSLLDYPFAFFLGELLYGGREIFPLSFVLSIDQKTGQSLCCIDFGSVWALW